MTKQKDRPKIGLALSGASSRAIFYIGFLEVLSEHKIPVDYIAATSSGSLVAMAYACNTLPQLKEHVFRLNRNNVFAICGKASLRGRGLYSLDALEQQYRYFSRGLRFEDVKPLMSFIAADIDRGEEVVISMGDIARAARISCTVPGLFEPTDWGGRTLVDGGLLNVIPFDQVRQAGADITISVDIPGTQHIFLPEHIFARKIVKAIKKMFLVNKASALWYKAQVVLAESASGTVFEIELPEQPRQLNSLFSVLGRCLDLAIEARKKEFSIEINPHTDFYITPLVPKGRLAAFESNQQTYETGRKTAEQFVERIKKTIENFNELSKKPDRLNIRLE